MFLQIYAMTVKELKVLLRDRGEITTLFILPIVFILVMTVALQGVFDSGGSNNPVSLLVVNEDAGELSRNVIADLREIDGIRLVEDQDGQALDRAAAEGLITSGRYSIALVFPAEFSNRIRAAATDPQTGGTTVTFVSDPAVGQQLLTPVQGMVQGFVEREASMAQADARINAGLARAAAQVPAQQAGLVQELGAQLATDLDTAQNDTSGAGVAFQVVAPAEYHAVKMPSSAEQNVPGYTIYGVFFIISAIASGLFREKDDGTFRRLQAAPVSRGVLLAGKLLPYYIINLIQVALMFAIGVFVFHIGLGRDPLALILVTLVTALAATGLGLLIATLGKTLAQVSSLGTILAIVLSVVGGMMVPVYVMPRFMQSVAYATPHAWALSGYLDIMVRGLGVSAVLPAVGALLAFAAVFWILGIWRFRFE